MDKKKSVTKKVFTILGNVLFWGFIVLITSWAVVNGIDKHNGYNSPFFGYRSSVIVSSSMATVNDANTSYITNKMSRIYKYDVIVTKNYKSYNEIKMYDVLTFYSAENGLICHRVVDLYEDNGVKYIVTRGDANNTDDLPINYSLVRGKVVEVHRGVGQVLLFLQSGYFAVGLSGSIFFICLGIFICDFALGKKNKNQETKGNDNNEKE